MKIHPTNFALPPATMTGRPHSGAPDSTEHPPALAYTSVAAFAAAAGIGRTTAYAEVAAGRLRTAKVGRRTIVPIKEAQRWLSERMAAGEAA